MRETVQLMTEAWQVMVGRLPSPYVESGAGVATCFGNDSLMFFNVSLIERPAAGAEDFRGLLGTVAARAKHCPHASALVVREDWAPADWEALLAEGGWAKMMTLTGMETTAVRPPRRAPAALEMRRVTDLATARDLAELNAQAYGMPEELFASIGRLDLWHADTHGYVGYDAGQAVSCAAAFPLVDSVYIAFVATRPGRQGRGYAETVMRHAMAEGQRAMGLQHVSLHATDMGLPVYRAMGFEVGPRLAFAGPAGH